MDKNCYNLWRQVLDECFSVRAFSVVKPQILPIVKKQPIGCFFVKNVLYPGTIRGMNLWNYEKNK